VDNASTPLVSVLLPVRNAAATLDRALGSIRSQTLTGWELLVLDDGSTDASRAIAHGHAAADSRVRVLELPRGGIVDALNHGLGAARGRYFARMDADDVCDPNRLEVQSSFLDRHPEVGLLGCHVRFGGKPAAAAGYAAHVEWLNGLVNREAVLLNRFVESPFVHPSVMFRREIPAQHGSYRDGEFPEDYELWLRWIAAGVVVDVIPLPLLTWSDSPQRLSRTDGRYAPDAFFRVKAPYVAAAVRETFQRQGRARPVYVWGAGRPTRKRADPLEAFGLQIAGYVDIDPKKTDRKVGGTGKPVVSADKLPNPKNAFILTYVANRGARELIRARLRIAGYVEGQDFLVCA
jgi:glycosyltransferase involved in cell wall biosynthesis